VTPTPIKCQAEQQQPADEQQPAGEQQPGGEQQPAGERPTPGEQQPAVARPTPGEPTTDAKQPIVEQDTAEPVVEQAIAEPVVEQAIAEPVVEQVIVEHVEQVTAEPASVMRFEDCIVQDDEVEEWFVVPTQVFFPRDMQARMALFSSMNDLCQFCERLQNLDISHGIVKGFLCKSCCMHLASTDAFKCACTRTRIVYSDGKVADRCMTCDKEHYMDEVKKSIKRDSAQNGRHTSAPSYGKRGNRKN